MNIESNVAQALRELEEDADYQFLCNYPVKNVPDKLVASEILPCTAADWNYTLYNGHLADKSVEYIKNAIKAAYFLLAVLDTFVFKVADTKHAFTFDSKEFHITDLDAAAAGSIYNGGFFGLVTDKAYLIRPYRIALAKPATEVDYKHWPATLYFRFTDHQGDNRDVSWETNSEKLTDVFSFNNFQKILDDVAKVL